MKRRLVVYSLRADQDFAWIYDAIAQAAGPMRALAYVERIRSFCETLEYAFERGTPRNDVRPGLRVIGFQRRVSVAFVAEPDRVIVLRISYGGADWQDDLKEGTGH